MTCKPYMVKLEELDCGCVFVVPYIDPSSYILITAPLHVDFKKHNFDEFMFVNLNTGSILSSFSRDLLVHPVKGEFLVKG